MMYQHQMYQNQMYAQQQYFNQKPSDVGNEGQGDWHSDLSDVKPVELWCPSWDQRRFQLPILKL